MADESMDSDDTPKILIQGVTHEGKKFRPSDWAERVSGSLSEIKNHRIYYSPMLRPTMKDGNKCVLLDPKLKQVNPELYEYILRFAENNNLKICGEDDEDAE